MSSSYSIQQLPARERPRERLLEQGPEAMATAELIAIILGSGMQGLSVLQLAQHIIAHFGTLGSIADATVEELCHIRGLGRAKAVQLKAAFSLGMRATKQKVPLKYRVEHPVHAYHLVKEELENAKRELLVSILLDAKGYVICHPVVAIGTLSHSLVHPREVYYPAIRHKAVSLIVAHNHPSGDPSPSEDDRVVTQQLVEAGKVVGIPLRDHLIIGNGRFVSLRQLGSVF